MPSPPATVHAVFKSDDRSRVELISQPGDDASRRVRKRFTYSNLKQCLTYWIGRHPAQLERRAARWLDKLDVPVVPVDSVYPLVSRATRRCFQVTVITPYAGPSLQQALRDARPDDHPRLLAAVAPLVDRLLDQRVWFKDLKSSNIVLGPDAPDALDPRLIDAGSARRGLSADQRRRMLDMLRQTCRADGADFAVVIAHLPR